MNFPFLPKLKSNPAVNIQNCGDFEKGELGALIRSLEVKTRISEESIDSIPDIWAQPLLFAMALFDDDGEGDRQLAAGLHERTVGEWRGLLALLAFNKYYNLKLKVTLVELDAFADNSFAKALLRLKPKKRISADTDWNKLYVIEYQDHPIGMTSPLSLVCTAKNLLGRLGNLTAVSWHNGKYLTDPTAKDLSKDERAHLKAWLSKLYGDLTKHGVYKGFDLLLKEIDTFIKDLGDIDATGCSFSKGGFNINTGVFQYLDYEVEIQEDSTSHLRLELSKGKEVAKPKPLVILGADIAEQWRMLPSSLTVYNRKGLNLLANGGKEVYRNGAIEVKFPDEFFIEKLTVLEGEKRFPGMLPIIGAFDVTLAGRSATPLVPLKKEILRYLSAEDIAGRLTFVDREEEITVRFRFPLSGVNGVRDYTFEKIYPKKDVRQLDNPPIIALWPKLKSANWRNYYLFYSNEYAWDTRNLLGVNQLFVQPWGVKTERIEEEGRSNHYVGKLDGFPEALTAVTNLEEAGAATIKDAGLILLIQPAESKPTNSPWHIGVDFGTSSTMVYYRKGSGDEEPKLLELQNRVFDICNGGETSKTGKYFIPNDKINGSDSILKNNSFLSEFYLLSKRSGEEIKEILDGHVWYPEGTDTGSKSALKEGEGEIIQNLKWVETSKERTVSALFLRQICLQCAAEAVCAGAEKIEWRFSYPTAFSHEGETAFMNTCKNIAADTAGNSGTLKTDSKFMTESTCSALYFAKQPKFSATFIQGAVCMDIGAGTTDISVWQGEGNRVVYQTSVKFAGKELFESVERIVRQVFDVKDDFLYEIRANGEKWLEKLPLHSGDIVVQKLLAAAECGVAGLFFYLGLLLRHLSEGGEYKGDTLPNIYLGGNGARILDWLSLGDFSLGGKTDKLLKACLYNASGFSQSGTEGDIHKSGNPKAEVAYGLVNDVELKGSLGGSHSVLAGNAFSYQGSLKTWRETINSHMFEHDLHINDLEKFEEFANFYYAHKGKDGERDAADLKANSFKILGQVKQQFVKKDPKKVILKPIFIACLEELMK